jgi:hypothetical protein
MGGFKQGILFRENAIVTEFFCTVKTDMNE